MAYAGWILFVVAVWWYRGQLKSSHERRQNVCDYAIHLLLHDEIRDNHKVKFEEWIDAELILPGGTDHAHENLTEYLLQAHLAIEDVARKLSQVSTMGSARLLAGFMRRSNGTATNRAEASPAT